MCKHAENHAYLHKNVPHHLEENSVLVPEAMFASDQHLEVVNCLWDHITKQRNCYVLAHSLVLGTVDPVDLHRQVHKILQAHQLRSIGGMNENASQKPSCTLCFHKSLHFRGVRQISTLMKRRALARDGNPCQNCASVHAQNKASLKMHLTQEISHRHSHSEPVRNVLGPMSILQRLVYIRLAFFVVHVSIICVIRRVHWGGRRWDS